MRSSPVPKREKALGALGKKGKGLRQRTGDKSGRKSAISPLFSRNTTFPRANDRSSLGSPQRRRAMHFARGCNCPKEPLSVCVCVCVSVRSDLTRCAIGVFFADALREKCFLYGVEMSVFYWHCALFSFEWRQVCGE